MERKSFEVLMLEVDWLRLRRSSEGVLMLRVALAVNDIASANYLLWHTTTGNHQVPDYLRDAFQLYGLRLRCGHLHEAAQLIGKVQKTQNLAKYIQQLEPETQQKYQLLQRLQKGGSDFDDYEKYVSNVRNKLVFHYDPEEVSQALDQITNDADVSQGRVIIGEVEGYRTYAVVGSVKRGAAR